MRWVVAVLGVLIVMVTLGSVVRSLLIPRGHTGRVQRAADQVVVLTLRARNWRTTEFSVRDSRLAAAAPMTLGLVLALWLTGLWIGFSCLLYPFVHSIGGSAREAGSSILTLGFASTNRKGATAIDFLAALTGLATVALQVGYLPTLYSAFNRRETEVTLLGARAGQPPWGPELLARTQLGMQAEEALDGLYEQWERWAADVAESHSSYPVLLRFRSPQPYASWLVALLSVMDSAALYHAVAPSRAPVSGRLVLRMGFTCLRQLADAIDLAYDPDPMPDSGIELSRAEFDEGLDRMDAAGFVFERTRDEAWVQFQGWRVNYEALAYRLAWDIGAVPVKWSGPRRFAHEPMTPLRPPARTPESPEGAPFRAALGIEERHPLDGEIAATDGEVGGT